jgi:hypothetical protein
MDIAVSALISDLRVNPPVIRTGGDNVDQNDISYNKAFPYAATPLNGRTRGVNTGDRANTTTTLTSTPNASAFGQLVTFTATVNSSGGTPTGGDVIFREGANILATVPLGPFGQASIGISTLSVGSHNVTADYIGTASFSDSSSSTTHVVNKANTAITLNSGTNPSIATQSVGFTFNVTSTAGPLSGAVNIFRGTLQIGTAPFSNGVGTFSTSFTISGTYPIKVVYPGNATFNGSESNVVMQVVNPTGGTTP